MDENKEREGRGRDEEREGRGIDKAGEGGENRLFQKRIGKAP